MARAGSPGSPSIADPTNGGISKAPLEPVGYTSEMFLRMPFLVAALAALAAAQNPYEKLPRNYQLELENEYVRVSRVRYFPGDKLAVHAHPSIPTVYVYLTDGGPVRFTHVTPKFTVERRAVKAGGVRFNRNAKTETHETEYMGDAESEYLRIEMKTTPGPPHPDARLRTAADFPWEDPQVRISSTESKPRPNHPAVIVDITRRSFTWFHPEGAPASATEEGRFVIVELKSTTANR
jgi:hypothetical protein